MSKYSIVYIQSGGPTPVINSSFYGLIKAALKDKNVDKIYGGVYGIEGLINDNLEDVKKWSPKQIECLLQTPGAVLGSSRKNLGDDYNDETFTKILNVCKKRNIKKIFVNGGNDSMSNGYKLKTYFDMKGVEDINVIGIPKTVDNDLIGVDFCLGFPSAAAYLVNTVKCIAADYDSMSKQKVCIVEVMGRETGWLTAASSVIDKEFRPDLIYVPETKTTLKSFLEEVKKVYDKKKKCLVVISEGLNLKELEVTEKDPHGNKVLEGFISRFLQNQIVEKLKIGCRVALLSLCTRSNACFISKVDSDMAVKIGQFAYKASFKEDGKMVGIKRVSNKPLKFDLNLVEFKNVEHKTRYFNEFLNSDGSINKKYETYLKPLITGLKPIHFTDGIIDLTHLKK